MTYKRRANYTTAMVSRLLLLAVSLCVCACSTMDESDTTTAEGAFAQAQRFEKNERFEEAINYYSEVKNKHPYSRLAVDAELKVADIQFQRENFVEAESAYRLFREFHPDHARADYVTFRTGLSIFKQLPPSIDRDLALALEAIRYFDEVLSSYSGSPLAKEAAEYKGKAVKMLAEKELYVADFYFKRKHYESALGRYEDVLRSYPKIGFDIKALYGATVSAYRINDKDKAKTYFKRLLAEHPKSAELEQARRELSDGF